MDEISCDLRAQLRNVGARCLAVEQELGHHLTRARTYEDEENTMSAAEPSGARRGEKGAAPLHCVAAAIRATAAEKAKERER